MDCPLASALTSEGKLQRKLNDSGTGTEAQNFTEIRSADVAFVVWNAPASLHRCPQPFAFGDDQREDRLVEISILPN